MDLLEAIDNVLDNLEFENDDCDSTRGISLYGSKYDFLYPPSKLEIFISFSLDLLRSVKEERDTLKKFSIECEGCENNSLNQDDHLDGCLKDIP